MNPDTIEAQVESGIIYGLTAAMYGEITIENGQVVQGNFPAWPGLKGIPRCMQIWGFRQGNGLFLIQGSLLPVIMFQKALGFVVLWQNHPTTYISNGL